MACRMDDTLVTGDDKDEILHSKASLDLENDPTECRKIVGKLNFQTDTSPDPTFVVQFFSRFM